VGSSLPNRTQGSRSACPIEVSVAREGIGADSTWYQDWQL
jgi:hypothetical protein